MNHAWETSAACRGMDPNLFHPERGEHRSDREETLEAVNTCATCPVRMHCLDWGMRWKHGIYGGWPAQYRMITRRQDRGCPWCGWPLQRFKDRRMFCTDECVKAAETAEGGQRAEVDTRLLVLLEEAAEWERTRKKRGAKGPEHDDDTGWVQLAIAV